MTLRGVSEQRQFFARCVKQLAVEVRGHISTSLPVIGVFALAIATSVVEQ